MKKSSHGIKHERTAPDWTLLGASLLLVCIGIIMIYSASGATALEKYHYVVRQSLFALIGYMCIFSIMYTPIGIVHRMHYVVLGIAFVALLAVFTPIGVSINGARRWLQIGSVSVQPMEFTRIALVLYISYFIGTKQEQIRSLGRGLLPVGVVTSIMAVLLMLQPDFGGAFFLFAILFILCLVGGAKKIYLFSFLGVFTGVATILIATSPYRMKRVLSFLDPFKDASNTGYQVVQSLYAVASGGLFGAGLGEGKQKLYYLPEAHNDFIFAVIAEELGFLGVSFLFALYTYIFIRAYAIILAQKSLRDKLLTFGATLILMGSTLFNIGVVVGVLPPKGIALPFLSYGGSSLVASCICLGILLRFSYQATE